jgi:hypothetical protein
MTLPPSETLPPVEMFFPAQFIETNFVHFFLGRSTPTLLRCTDLFQWPEIQVSFKTLVINIIFRFFSCMYNFCLHKCGILIQCDYLVSLCAD